jgi:tRNA 2-thiouridine synthesizing protein E
MSDYKSVTDNPAPPGIHPAGHEADLQGWDEEQGRRNAELEGIALGDAHWAVIHCLRDHYREHGPAENGRDVSDMLDERFADQGGRKYLRKLFPRGPVAQGMRIAGLPVPPHTEDESFGISR